MAFAPHLATLVIATLAIGWLMTMAGLQKNALELQEAPAGLPVLRAAHRNAALPDLRLALLRLLRRLALELQRDARGRPA